ncbi:hypothetical protein CSB85_5931 [Pseudomonas aeruginosa]|nr:hypothetical protein CSB85_5931 [Pseudomonas aeruginosa]AWE77686.1 hypothetical protein CSC31_6073 [Pseudomonas aeruginosa]CDO85283.1 hypothetical protein PSPA7 0608 [Pseudomonas aeruginosa]
MWGILDRTDRRPGASGNKMEARKACRGRVYTTNISDL